MYMHYPYLYPTLLNPPPPKNQQPINHINPHLNQSSPNSIITLFYTLQVSPPKTNNHATTHHIKHHPSPHLPTPGGDGGLTPQNQQPLNHINSSHPTIPPHTPHPPSNQHRW